MNSHTRLRKFGFICLLPILLIATAAQGAEHVVLLHGLARSSSSLDKMERSLSEAGFITHNLDYPSRSQSIESLSRDLRTEIATKTASAETVHFVTHSMGGIILRQIQQTAPLPNIGRVVMLSPPNHGSEIVDRLGHTWAFQQLNGPAGQQLGTAEDSFVQQLGPIDFELAVITGDRSINWILSTLIPGKDDGKVSLKSAQLDGMNAYQVIHATHTFIMRNKHAIAATKSFLKTGSIGI